MSRLSSKSTIVIYLAETRLGELLPVPIPNKEISLPGNEIRIHHLSPVSERCHPLSVLHTLSPFSLRLKLEPHQSSSDKDWNNEEKNNNIQLLLNLHASCFYKLKTAVVLLDNEELHLVAMPSKQKKFPCFWCFSIPRYCSSVGLYDYCLGLLNVRCLSIVFDLDETLIVANTLKSFEDRIEALKGWIAREGDLLRANGMSAELKRYVDDRALLKQYAENDCVVGDGGKVYKAVFEEVLPVLDNQESFSRPVIRLPDKNLVLTRINPENRDTSVLVRLRPAWEDLRSYLKAKGRKRFEVFVCTMAERDYALEMWRLLDPEANLINSKQLLNRVVCVKSGSRKSLLNVFQDGICHPNMAMVIDDRLKVWEDKDQSRVHVVPAFTPYYAPQAETANAVPVLCVARNVACNVRGGFFKEFDEILLRKIFELFYEDEMSNLPSPPDVSNYLLSEETGFVPNGNTNIPFSEGISGAEVEQRLPQSEEKSAVDADNNSVNNILDLRSENPQQSIPSVANAANPLRTTIPAQKGLLGAPAKKEAKSSISDPPILRLPGQTSQGGWLAEEDGNRGYSRGYLPLHESDVSKSGKSRAYPSSVGNSTVPSAPPFQISKGRAEEISPGQEALKNNFPLSNSTGSVDAAESKNLAPSLNKETHADAIKVTALPSSLSISVLQEIGRRCFSKVEFKPVLSTSKDLQFSVEVLFTGEKIGVGMGKTRKDAQQQAAENALRCLADKYLAYVTPSCMMERDNKDSNENENGFIWDDLDAQLDEQSSDEKHRENGLEAVELAPGSTSSMVINQQTQQRVANSPRLQQSPSIKRSREEMLRGSQSSSARQQRNGHPFS